MANVVIRKGVVGFELNYGPLVVCEVAGIKCAMEDWRAEQLKVTVLDTEEIPEFLLHMKLVMQFAVAQIYVYLFDTAGIRALGKALSELTTLGVVERVSCNHSSRMLATWVNGQLTSDPVTIDHFYLDQTDEQIEASRF